MYIFNAILLKIQLSLSEFKRLYLHSRLHYFFKISSGEAPQTPTNGRGHPSRTLPTRPFGPREPPPPRWTYGSTTGILFIQEKLCSLKAYFSYSGALTYKIRVIKPAADTHYNNILWSRESILKRNFYKSSQYFDTKLGKYLYPYVFYLCRKNCVV